MSSRDSTSFTAATRARRSMRSLDAKCPVSDAAVAKIAEEALLYVPSAFNSQTTRSSVLLHEDHRKLWSITSDILRIKMGEERFSKSSGQMPSTAQKLQNFAKAYGTMLFWDDLDAVEKFRDGCPEIYKDKVDEWVHQSNGMHQYHVWAALESYGLGANLQRYNPLVDDLVRSTWGLPQNWALRAQMVFGMPEEGSSLPEKAQNVPVAERLSVHGAKCVGPAAANS